MSEYRWENPHRNQPNWHKGQIHCHDDAPTAEVLARYKAAKYSFACVTPHNNSSPDVNVDGILHIRSGEDGRFYRHHIIVLGVDFSKIDPHVDSNRNGIADYSTCPCANIGPRLNYYTGVQKTVAVLAHPHQNHGHSWTKHRFALCGEGWTLEELKLYSNQSTGIEIYNASVGHCDDWWDQVLRSYKQMWGFGSDDMHSLDSKYNFNRSWIVVNSTRASAEQRDVLDNIRAGNFHTVVRDPHVTGEPGGGEIDWIGPELHITADAQSIKVETEEDSEIALIGCRNGVPTSVGSVGRRRQIVYEAMEGDNYYRAVVSRTKFGHQYASYSQPIFRAIVIG